MVVGAGCSWSHGTCSEAVEVRTGAQLLLGLSPENSDTHTSATPRTGLPTSTQLETAHLCPEIGLLG